MGRRADDHRSGLRLSRVFPSVATMLVLPSPQESPVTDGNGSRDFFAATLYEAIPQAFVAQKTRSVPTLRRPSNSAKFLPPKPTQH